MQSHFSLNSAKMIRLLNSRLLSSLKRQAFISSRLSSSSANDPNVEEPVWKDPFKHALPKEEKTFTDYEEVPVNWSYVDRLFAPELIPEMPKTQEVTASGWRPPKDPVPDLPYYIRRSRYHLPELFLERRRDQLNPKTMLYEYVEVVALRGIFGDLFACEQDLKQFLEAKVEHPVATYIDELKGVIKVRGADRSLIELFMSCTNCMKKYTVLRKEHGCSNCAYGFCQKCLTKKFLLPKLSPKPVSVCDGCFQSLTGGIVQPLEKVRNESTEDGSNWWGDGKPPPSMRHFYPTKPKLLKSKDEEKKKLTDAEQETELAERIAKLTNKTVDEVMNPRYMVSDRDSGDIPSTSADILSNLRQPTDPMAKLTTLNTAPKDDKTDKLNFPKPPPAENSLEDLEERLAALRNVPVDVIRNPRLLVMNEGDDSEPELSEDAKNLLNRAEQRLRKKEPDLFYENEAWSDSDD
ncbi:hypothetical protein M3Y97_00025500 [Aphelenchoides bicaudatus]|nr:hypothetical protein M3Y97_00025500 [Aphelenchoides bicaudatus]